MKLSDFKPGDQVRIEPETTAFDLPVWTIREKGVVLALGIKRVKVKLDGGAVYAVDPKDLQLQDEPQAAPRVTETDGLRPGDGLDKADWELILEALERAASVEPMRSKRDRFRELAAKFQRPDPEERRRLRELEDLRRLSTFHPPIT